LGTAEPNGVVSLDLKQIHDYAASLQAANPTLPLSNIIANVGASIIAHEATHEFDMKNDWHGSPPPSSAAEYRTEINAYTAEQSVDRSLGYTTGLYQRSMTNDDMRQVVVRSAQGSLDVWLKAGGSRK
jgi:hypothetical protein